MGPESGLSYSVTFVVVQTARSRPGRDPPCSHRLSSTQTTTTATPRISLLRERMQRAVPPKQNGRHHFGVLQPYCIHKHLIAVSYMS